MILWSFQSIFFIEKHKLPICKLIVVDLMRCEKHIASEYMFVKFFVTFG